MKSSRNSGQQGPGPGQARTWFGACRDLVQARPGPGSGPAPRHGPGIGRGLKKFCKGVKKEIERSGADIF